MGSSSRQKYDQAVKDYSDLRHMLNTKRQVYEEKETTEKGGADDDAQSKVDHEKEKSKEGPTDMEKILETMKEMNAKIEEKLEARLGILEAEKGLKPMELTLATTSSPFTKEILEFKLPRDFKQPKIRLYDGTTDPVDFLSDFALWMDVKEAGDAMKCRAFPLLLSGSAKDWFQSLKANSISSFELLRVSFMNQFLTASKRQHPPSYLLSIKQKPDESLRAFLNRFSSKVTKIQGCPTDTAYTALLAGLQKGPFLFHVNKFPPKTYADLLNEAYRRAIVEEMTYDAPEPKEAKPITGEKRREDRGQQQHYNKHEKRGRYDNHKRGNEDRDQPRRYSPPKNTYTLLNTTREEVLHQIQAELP